MVTLRGRAATPVRPGLVAKSVLMGEIPLATGELVTQAAITDLHNAYKELVRRENDLRPRAKRLKPMTMQSFKTLFKFSQLLGLVELVREESMQFPPPTGNLFSLRKDERTTLGVRAVISTRRIFRITSLGAEDEKSWTNLCKAWIEGWPAPQKAEYLPPVYVPREPRVPKEKPPKVERPPRVPMEFTPYVWREPFSPSNLMALVKHIRVLGSLSIDSPGVVTEVSGLAGKLGGWIVEADEAYDEVKSVGYISEMRRFERIRTYLTNAREALLDHDLERATSSLEELAG